MKNFSIITDSCCSLTDAEVRELGIQVLPLAFTLDGQSYLDTPDHKDLSPVTFFNRIRNGSICNTAAVNFAQFSNAMRTELSRGKDVLCICFSGALSCTYQNACMAAQELQEEYPSSKIIVIDSHCACRGLGMLICRTVREQREKYMSIEETAEFLMREREKQAHWFFVDDLMHLQRGGRVKKIAAVTGTVLGIKPIMHCNADGELTVAGKVQGINKAIRAMILKMRETLLNSDIGQSVFICHANCPEYVQKLTKQIREEFGITDIRTGYISPVIGAHTGCGTVGVFYVAKSR